MFCTNCGSKNEDHANFCLKCGRPLHQIPPVPGQPAIPQPPLKQPEINTQQQPMPSQGQLQQPQQPKQEQPPLFQKPPLQQYQPVPQPAVQQGPFSNTSDLKAPKKSKKSFLPWTIAIAFILVVAIIAVVLFLFPKKTPIMDTIINAINGTLEAESLEFSVNCEIEDYDTMSADGAITYDLNNGKLNFDINAETMEYILYDNFFIAFDQGSEEYRQNITDELKLFYDYYDEYQTSRKNKKDMDWKDVLSTAGLSSYINEKELNNCIEQLKKKLNDKDFYKTVCKEFTVKKTKAGTEYFFDIDATKMMTAVIEIIKPAINYDDMDGIIEELSAQTDEIKDLTIKITTAEGKLANLELTYNADGSTDISGKISLNIGFDKYNDASLEENRLMELINAATDTTSEATDVTQAVPTMMPTPDPNTLGAADLDLWYINYEGGDPIIDDSINRFKADNPQCNVNVTVMDSSEYNTILETSMASGDMPDIFVTWGDCTYYNYITNGMIQDITSYMQQDNYKDRFLDAGISQATYKDKIYGVPTGSSAIYGIFYNKDIFNQYGFQEPTTIAELEQICNTFTANGITPFELGNSTSFYGSMYFSCLAARKSGVDPMMSLYEGNYNAMEDGFLYAGGKIQEWVGNGYFNEGFNNMEDYNALAEFCSGNGAMYLSGSWSTYSLQSQMAGYPDSVGFFAFPAYSENDDNSDIAIGSVGGTFYSVSSMCENPEAAFKAITYLIDDSVMGQRINNSYLLPLKNFMPYDVMEQKIMETVNKADASFQIYDAYLPSDVESVYYSNLRSLFDLSIGPKEFFDMIRELYN